MNKLTKYTELKWIILSLLIHSSLVGAVIFFKEETKKVATVNQPISVDLSIVQIPKKNLEQPKKEIKKKEIVKEKIVKKVIKPKTVKKILEKKPKVVKKIIKPNNLIAKKVVEKIVEKTLKTKELVTTNEKIVTPEKKVKVQPKKVKNPIQTTNMHSKSMQRKNFIETNFAIIRNKVLANLIYPHIAKKMGFQGTTTIELQIDSLGNLLHVKLTKSSGKKLLDKAAISAGLKLKNTKLPIPKNNTKVVLPIVFKIS